MVEWTEGFQRAYLSALLAGMVGHRLDALAVDLFTGARSEIASAVFAFHEKEREWPSFDFLPALVGEEAAKELIFIRRQTRGAQQHAAREGGQVLRREALRSFALSLDGSAAEGSAEEWADLPRRLSEALSVASQTPPPFSYREGFMERHCARNFEFTAPTGVDALDRAREGGIHEGELGFVLGGTNMGKSQLMVHFGAAHLMRGGYVLHVSLEMPSSAVAARYDRNITNLDKWEIREDMARAERIRNEKINPDFLAIHAFPRGSIGVQYLYPMVQEAKQKWQRAPLLIVDYFSLLRGTGTDERHREVAQISADLSALALSEKIGIWSPFQVNRAGYAKVGSVSLDDAGESFAATQHPDYLVSMNVTGPMQMNLNVVKDRSFPFASATVRTDWSRSRLQPEVAS